MLRHHKASRLSATLRWALGRPRSLVSRLPGASSGAAGVLGLPAASLGHGLSGSRPAKGPVPLEDLAKRLTAAPKRSPSRPSKDPPPGSRASPWEAQGRGALARGSVHEVSEILLRDSSMALAPLPKALLDSPSWVVQTVLAVVTNHSRHLAKAIAGFRAAHSAGSAFQGCNLSPREQRGTLESLLRLYVLGPGKLDGPPCDLNEQVAQSLVQVFSALSSPSPPRPHDLTHSLPETYPSKSPDRAAADLSWVLSEIIQVNVRRPYFATRTWIEYVPREIYRALHRKDRPGPPTDFVETRGPVPPHVLRFARALAQGKTTLQYAVCVRLLLLFKHARDLPGLQSVMEMVRGLPDPPATLTYNIYLSGLIGIRHLQRQRMDPVDRFWYCPVLDAMARDSCPLNLVTLNLLVRGCIPSIAAWEGVQGVSPSQAFARPSIRTLEAAFWNVIGLFTRENIQPDGATLYFVTRFAAKISSRAVLDRVLALPAFQAIPWTPRNWDEILRAFAYFGDYDAWLAMWQRRQAPDAGPLTPQCYEAWVLAWFLHAARRGDTEATWKVQVQTIVDHWKAQRPQAVAVAAPADSEHNTQNPALALDTLLSTPSPAAKTPATRDTLSPEGLKPPGVALPPEFPLSIVTTVVSKLLDADLPHETMDLLNQHLTWGPPPDHLPKLYSQAMSRKSLLILLKASSRLGKFHLSHFVPAFRALHAMPRTPALESPFPWTMYLASLQNYLGLLTDSGQSNARKIISRELEGLLIDMERDGLGHSRRDRVFESHLLQLYGELGDLDKAQVLWERLTGLDYIQFLLRPDPQLSRKATAPTLAPKAVPPLPFNYPNGKPPMAHPVTVLQSSLDRDYNVPHVIFLGILTRLRPVDAVDFFECLKTLQTVNPESPIISRETYAVILKFTTQPDSLDLPTTLKLYEEAAARNFRGFDFDCLLMTGLARAGEGVHRAQDVVDTGEVSDTPSTGHMTRVLAIWENICRARGYQEGLLGPAWRANSRPKPGQPSRLFPKPSLEPVEAPAAHSGSSTGAAASDPRGLEAALSVILDACGWNGYFAQGLRIFRQALKQHPFQSAMPRCLRLNDNHWCSFLELLLRGLDSRAVSEAAVLDWAADMRRRGWGLRESPKLRKNLGGMLAARGRTILREKLLVILG